MAGIERSGPRGSLSPLFFVTALGALCAFAFLDDKSVSYDEGISLWFAQLDWTQLWRGATVSDPLIAPYYGVLHAWSGLFGHSSAAARGLSAVCATALIPAIYRVAERLIDRRTAVVAGVICATSPYFVSYAQEARAYAPAMFLSALSMAAFLRFLSRPDKASQGLYAAACIGAIYAHAFAALLVVAQLASLPLLRAEGQRYARPAAFVAGAIIVFSLPLVAMQLAAGLSRLAWIPVPRIDAPARLIVDYMGSPAGASIAILCCAFLLVPRAFAGRRKTIAAIALWSAIPLIGTCALSLLHPAFVARYLACAFPAFALLVAAGMTSLRRPIVSYALLALLTAFSLGVIWPKRGVSRLDFRSAAVFVARRAGPRDAVIVFEPAADFAFRAEISRAGLRLHAPAVYPPRTWPFWAPEFGHFEPIPLGRYDRLWLVLISHDPARRIAVLRRIGQRYRLRTSTVFTQITVDRFDARTAPSAITNSDAMKRNRAASSARRLRPPRSHPA